MGYALVSYSRDHSVPLNLKCLEFMSPTDTESELKAFPLPPVERVEEADTE